MWDPLGSTGYVDLLAETAADQSVPRQYWRGASLVSYKEPAQKAVYQCDHLGNTERLVDGAQAVAASYQASAWGEALSSSGTLAGQCFQYGGAWGAFRDALSGQAWMRRRVMKPGMGCFVSPSPSARAAPNYLYSTNSPVKDSDPSGLDWPQDAGAEPSGIGWPDRKQIWDCARKCWNASDKIECLGGCLSDALIDQNCWYIVCMILDHKEFCVEPLSGRGYSDPCLLKKKRVDSCHGCCSVHYYCCLMKVRNFKGVVKCEPEARDCLLKCDLQFVCRGPVLPTPARVGA